MLETEIVQNLKLLSALSSSSSLSHFFFFGFFAAVVFIIILSEDIFTSNLEVAAPRFHY